MMLTIIALLGAHALCDYALQGDFMAKAKNPVDPFVGIPWQQPMAAHCMIHGAAVALILGVWWLAIAEFVAHWITDEAKCRGKISFHVDQAIHVACKFAWLALAAAIG